MRRLTFFVVVAVCLPASSVAARKWTVTSGPRQVDGEFITADRGNVWLLHDDGEVLRVGSAELSSADQKHVRELLRERQTETSQLTQNPPGRVPYGPGLELCTLEDTQIAESSGLASSRRRPGFFWTHNDSGDEARIYLLDARGRNLGSCRLQDVLAYDFEDIFSFDRNGKSFLVLCDVGNNVRAAPVQILHVIEEPPFDPEKGLTVEQVPVIQTIYYSYEDDHRNCEAVGFDPTTKTILFATKEREPECHVYSLPWPVPNPDKAFTARRIATLKIPAATAMDVSPDGRRAMVLTYRNAYEFVRGQDEDWSRAFSRQAREIQLPQRVQGESICYATDGVTLYMTSENLPTPLIIVPVLK